ncbi:MAG: hypothetical protein JNL82_17865 [Myxococcales bacterium]|nr:hypothetical protein [Myxococcales bacterium]
MPGHDLKKLRAALIARRAELVAEGDVPVPMQRLDSVSKPDEDESKPPSPPILKTWTPGG